MKCGSGLCADTLCRVVVGFMSFPRHPLVPEAGGWVGRLRVRWVGGFERMGYIPGSFNGFHAGRYIAVYTYIRRRGEGHPMVGYSDCVL